MCKQLGISHAAYYKWLHRTIPEQESENTKLAELIKEYDERFGHILGWIHDGRLHFRQTVSSFPPILYILAEGPPRSLR